MTRDKINVHYPHLDNSQSVGEGVVEKTKIESQNGVEIVDAFENKNNSLVIIVENTGEDGVLIIRDGDSYPNSILGDLEIEIGGGSTNSLYIQDMSRFERKDGSMYIDFDDGFAGNIYAVAKSTRIND